MTFPFHPPHLTPRSSLVKIRKVKDSWHYSFFEQPPRELYVLEHALLNGASLRLSFAREFNTAWQRPVRTPHLSLS
jgi:hypothetical protein